MARTAKTIELDFKIPDEQLIEYVRMFKNAKTINFWDGMKMNVLERFKTWARLL